MAVRPLITFPSPILRQAATRIEEFGEETASLADDVRDTLDSVAAIGLTACHIGILRRLVVIRMTPGESARTYLNPSVLWSSPETERHEEGSVSMPGARETIERPVRIRIAYQDSTGAAFEEDASGFAAAVLLHEIDQLHGIFWIDRLSRLKRDRLMARFEKLRRRG